MNRWLVASVAPVYAIGVVLRELTDMSFFWLMFVVFALSYTAVVAADELDKRLD